LINQSNSPKLGLFAFGDILLLCKSTLLLRAGGCAGLTALWGGGGVSGLQHFMNS